MIEQTFSKDAVIRGNLKQLIAGEEKSFKLISKLTNANKVLVYSTIRNIGALEMDLGKWYHDASDGKRLMIERVKALSFPYAQNAGDSLVPIIAKDKEYIAEISVNMQAGLLRNMEGVNVEQAYSPDYLNKPYVVVTIQDNGEGVKDSSKLFTVVESEKLNSKYKEAYQSAGQGRSIYDLKEHMDLWNGIVIYKPLKQGSSFSFGFPLEHIVNGTNK